MPHFEQAGAGCFRRHEAANFFKEFRGCVFQQDLGLIFHGDQFIQADASLGTILCLDTLEHVEDPRAAVSELSRVLAPGGLLIMTSVFEFPIHGYPNDYWRFTPEGVRSLLKPFPSSFVGSYGLSEDVPRSVVGLGFKGGSPNTGFERDYANWKKWFEAIMHAQVSKASGGADPA